ncbi:MAG: peptidylprolyl isomerase [Armatimonadota bacterium]
MSLMSLRRKMAKRAGPIILWVLVAVFLLGVFLWSVPNKSLQGDGQAQIPQHIDIKKALALVDGITISTGDFESEFAKRLNDPTQSQQVGVTMVLNLRRQIFLELLQRTLVKAAMKRHHISDNIFAQNTYRAMARDYATITIADLRKEAETTVREEAERAKKDTKLKLRSVEEVLTEKLAGMMAQRGVTDVPKPTEKQFTNWFVNDFLLGKDKETGMYDQFIDHARMRRFGAMLIKELPTDPFSEAYVKKLQTQEVKASWIVINAKEQSTEALADAEKAAKAIHEQVVNNPAGFAALAKQKSEHEMTKTTGGSLDWISADTSFVPIVAQTLAFTLNKGEISPPTLVVVPSYWGPPQVGYAVLKVDDIRDRKVLPEGFNWDTQKQELILRTRQRYETQYGEFFLAQNRFRVKIEAVSPEVKAYIAEDAGDRNGADDAYRAALTETNVPELVKAGIKYTVSLKTPKSADKIPMLEAAMQYATADEITSIQMTLARAYQTAGRKDEAIRAFENAEATASDTDRDTREQILKEYKHLGYTEGVKKLTKWLSEHKETKQTDTPSMPMGLPPTR